MWDEVLPIEVRELPEDLARLDRVLSDPALLSPIAQAWEQGARDRGRPSIAMATFVRLMVIKQRTGWGYETLVREVSDSLHLRRFCLIAIDQRVPDESTVRKLARRLGAEVVEEITRIVIEKAQRETRFRGSGGEDRFDGRGGRHPLPIRRDARAAGRAGAGPGRQEAGRLIKGKRCGFATGRGRSGKAVRAISKTLARRTGEAKAEVMQLNEQAGRADRPLRTRSDTPGGRGPRRGERSWRPSQAPAAAEARAARRPLPASHRADRPPRRGLKITDRLVSIATPTRGRSARASSASPTEFGYVAQICEVTENTRSGARGFILPAAHAPGNPSENRLLAQTAGELDTGRDPPARDRRRRRFPCPARPHDAFPELEDEQIQLSGRHEPGSRRTRKRRARYRTGIEGRISHLKRGYGLRRSRLKGHDGMRTWTGWAILAYDLDTLAIRTR